MTDAPAATDRPERHGEPIASSAFGVIEKPLSTWERIGNVGALRKLAILAVLALIWELYARWLDNPLLFPTFGVTVQAFARGDPQRRAAGQGVDVDQGAAGRVRGGNTLRRGPHDRRHHDALRHRPPRAADLDVQPAAGDRAAAARADLVRARRRQHRVRAGALGAVGGRAQHALGFLSVSNTLRMVGRNYGLSGLSYVGRILIPAAFPSILTGLKIGWAFAWRTLIAAELVFGVSSGSGGLGWFIYENKNQLEIPAVFAGLFTVILFGLLVENVCFRTIEARTVRRWGMQS